MTVRNAAGRNAVEPLEHRTTRRNDVVRVTRVGTLYDMYDVSPPVSPTCTRAVRIKRLRLSHPGSRDCTDQGAFPAHFVRHVRISRASPRGCDFVPARSARRVAGQIGAQRNVARRRVRGRTSRAEAPHDKTSDGNPPLGKTVARSDVARHTCHASKSSRDTAQRKRRAAALRHLAAREIRRDARRNVRVA